VRSPATDVVLVLGDIGQMQEIGEGADDRQHRVAWQLGEDSLQLGARVFVEITIEAHRILADTFDDVEDLATLLLTDGVAENPAQQPNVLAQGKVLVGFGGAWIQRIHVSTFLSAG
jgi:hypothetical protein